MDGLGIISKKQTRKENLSLRLHHNLLRQWLDVWWSHCWFFHCGWHFTGKKHSLQTLCNILQFFCTCKIDICFCYDDSLKFRITGLFWNRCSKTLCIMLQQPQMLFSLFVHCLCDVAMCSLQTASKCALLFQLQYLIATSYYKWHRIHNSKTKALKHTHPIDLTPLLV